MNTLQLRFLMLIFAGWVNRRQQDVIGDTDGAVECQEKLGGVLKYYYRRAA